MNKTPFTAAGEPLPRKIHHLDGGRVTVLGFGRPENWSVRNTQTGEDAGDRVCAVVSTMNVPRVFAPWPWRFNAKIAKPSDFPCSRGRNGVTFFHGIFADGVVLSPQSAFFIASADCPTIVLYHPQSKTVVAAHGGRNSLLRGISLTAKASPLLPHRGVADEMVRSLRRVAGKPEESRVFSFCGVGPERFSHPFESPGHDNRALIDAIVRQYGDECVVGPHERGCIDLHAVIKAQFVRQGVPSDSIESDGVDTASGDEWWSHRRGTRERNGIFVFNRHEQD